MGENTLTPDQALKDLFSDVTDLVKLITDVSTGFKLREIWEAIGLLGDVKQLKGSIPDIYAQYRALDDQSRADLFAYVQANVQIPDYPAVSAIVDKVLDAAIALSAVFQLFAPAPTPGGN